MKRVGLIFGLKDETVANTEWLLDVLSSCNPEHEFFGKSYVPSAEDSKYSRKKVQPVVNNSNGFYDDLPVKRQKVKPANSNVNGIPIAQPRVHVRMQAPEARQHESADVRELRRKLTKMKIYIDKKQTELDQANLISGARMSAA